MCVCLQCSSEFEGSAVFRVDIWKKTIVTVTSFLELLISFLPISRDILLISYLAWLLVSNWKKNGILFTFEIWLCLCPFMSISLSCLAVCLRKRYASSNCFKEVIKGNLWEPAVQFSGTCM